MFFKCVKIFIKDLIYHTPKQILIDKEIESVKTNGLVHFTKYINKTSIEQNGIIGNFKKPMFKREKGFTWFYIYDIANFQEKRNIVLSKGERKEYDAFVVIKGLSDEQISRLRIRRETDNAVAYPGTLKTDDIVISKLQ